MNRIFTIFIISLLLAGCITTDRLVSSPDAIDWQYTGVRNYDETKGLGKSYRYESNIGWIDIYSYSLNRNNWSNGTADPSFDEHFKSVLAEIAMVERLGIYKNTAIERIEDVTIDGVAFRHAVVTYVMKDKPIESHIYLSAISGHLIKFRMSFYKPTPKNLNKEIDSFIKQAVKKYGS